MSYLALKSNRIALTLLAALMIVGVVVFIFPQNEKKDTLQTITGTPVAFAASQPIVIPLGYLVTDGRGAYRLVQEGLSVTGPLTRDSRDQFDVSVRMDDAGTPLLDIQPKGTLKPGRYHIAGKIETPAGIRDFSQDFYWGVLAMNFNKSVYRQGERGYLQFAVLDDEGNTLCGAGLDLEVRSPSGEAVVLSNRTDKTGRADRAITNNPACGPNNVIDEPDYYVYYTFEHHGTYQFELTAYTANGERTIRDYIEVRESVPFSVERIGPTRIYPFADYEMRIRITAEEDFEGKIEEIVPKSFELSNFQFPISNFQSNSHTQISNDQKIISWDVDIRAGETYELSYTFDAPDVSPEFYLLGPLTLTENTESTKTQKTLFEEARQWQVASDAEATIDGTVRANSPRGMGEPYSTVFVSDQVGYTFYGDSDALIVYSKTTNGGTSWGAAVSIGLEGLWAPVWYDRWTPGDDTGTYIHIAFGNATDDDVHYQRLDTANDSLLGQVSVNTVSTSVDGGDETAIVKGTNGTLYIAFSDATTSGASKVMSCSSDCGVSGNWSNVGTSPLDQDTDVVHMAPLSGGSIMLIRHDISLEDVQSNIWNGSTWAGWVDIDINAVAGASETSISAVTSKSNNNVYLAYASGTNTADCDVRTAVYNGSSWTAKTDVISNQNTCGSPRLAIDENNNDVYVVYLRGTATTAMNAYYKKSTDGMATWGGETQYNTTDTDMRMANINAMSKDRIYGTYWINTAGDDALYGNTIANLLATSTVTDTPDPTNPGRSVSWIVDWTGGALVKAKACKTNSLTSQNCDGGFWASSTDFTALDPFTITYDIAGADAGQTRNYFLFLCDNNGDCTGSTSGTFSVNTASDRPDITVRGNSKVRGGAYSAVTLEQSVSASGVKSDTLALPSWTPGANELILVTIATRDTSDTPNTVSGNGITFTQVLSVNDSGSISKLTVFRGMSASPSTGQITFSWAETTGTRGWSAVASRFSGVDTSGTNGSGAVEASNTKSENASNPSITITTLTNNAVAWGAFSWRGSALTLDGSLTAIVNNLKGGSSGDRVDLSAGYKSVATVGSATINGTNSADDWADGAVSIKPKITYGSMKVR